MASNFHEVRAHGVVKAFGPTLAIAEAELVLTEGTITTLEGANGSGKSTLLLLLALLLRPTQGAILFDGAHPKPAWKVRGQIGLVAHFPAAYLDLTAYENLLLAANLHGLPNAYERVAMIVERFGITEFCARPMRTYSRGQQQRVSLARAILSEPRLLLLDEPTTGLDGEGLDELERVLNEERDRGTIIALATHDRAWAKRLANRRIRLEYGRAMEIAL